MKIIISAAMVACMGFGAATAFAQDMPASAPSKKGMAAKGNMQDCKDRVATQKGEKRSDASVSGDVTQACADMPAKAPMKHHMKKDSMDAGTPASAPMK